MAAGSVTGNAVLQATIEEFANNMRGDGPGQLDDLFRSAGLSVPQVVWSPNPDHMDQPLIRTFHDALAPARDLRGRVSAQGLTLVNLAPFANSLIRLIPNEGCTDFLYTYYGRDVEAIYGRTLVGQTCLGGFDKLIGKYFYANYRAVCQKEMSCLTRHEPPKSVFANWWRRYVVPVFEPHGQLNEILTLSIPDNELAAGFNAMPFPLFVVDENHHVIFANRMAQIRFGYRKPFFETTIESYCGIDNFDEPLWALGPFQTNASFSRSVASTHTITTQDKQLLRLEVVGSPLIFRGRGFRMVMLREV